MPSDEEIRQRMRNTGKEALGREGEEENKAIRTNQDGLAQNALGIKGQNPSPPINTSPSNKSALTRFYSLVGAFVIGTTVFFVITSIIADFLQSHSVFADLLARVVVAIIGGITSVVVELIRTRQK